MPDRCGTNTAPGCCCRESARALSRWRRLQRPLRTAAQHQSLLHFVGQSPWSDETVLAKVASLVTPAIESTGRTEAWIIDDTSFPKERASILSAWRANIPANSVKQDNCQVAVSLSIANDAASLPVAYRLYLPQDWANDPARRQKGRRSGRCRLQDQADESLSTRSPPPAMRACRRASS